MSLWKFIVGEEQVESSIFKLPPTLLHTVLHKLIGPADWLRLARVCSRFNQLALSQDLWKLLHKNRFYYHNHEIQNESEIRWINVYKECHISERAGSKVMEHMKNIDNKKIFSPVKKKNFHCGWTPVSFSICFLGSAGCGKSTLISTFKGKKFSKEYISTMGAQSFKHLFPFDDEVVEFNFWDCSGQERYLSLTQKVIAFCDIVVIVYDCSCADSVDGVKPIFTDLQKSKSDFETCLLGLKCDVSDEKRAVPATDMGEFAYAKGIPFLGEVSSKTQENVPQALMSLYRIALKTRNSRS